jgi:hypothetical protein
MENPMSGTSNVTTTIAVSSPNPVEWRRSGGALYSQESATAARSNAPGIFPLEEFVKSTTAVKRGNMENARAAASATHRGSSPFVRTRLPPDQLVGVWFSRSASRSK